MKDERKPSMIEPTGTDVKHLYPEIVEYWISKGMPEQHIEITSSPYIEEDVLYLYGRFFGYCRNENEWKQLRDLKNKHVKTERLRKILNTEVPEKITITKEHALEVSKYFYEHRNDESNYEFVCASSNIERGGQILDTNFEDTRLNIKLTSKVSLYESVKRVAQQKEVSAMVAAQDLLREGLDRFDEKSKTISPSKLLIDYERVVNNYEGEASENWIIYADRSLVIRTRLRAGECKCSLSSFANYLIVEALNNYHDESLSNVSEIAKEEIDGRSYVVIIDQNKMNTALNSPRVTINTKLTSEEKRELILSYADEQPQELDGRIYNVIKGGSKCSDSDYTYKEGNTIEDIKEWFKND